MITAVAKLYSTTPSGHFPPWSFLFYSPSKQTNQPFFQQIKIQQIYSSKNIKTKSVTTLAGVAGMVPQMEWEPLLNLVILLEFSISPDGVCIGCGSK
jgi:hypothetical protein